MIIMSPIGRAMGFPPPPPPRRLWGAPNALLLRSVHSPCPAPCAHAASIAVCSARSAGPFFEDQVFQYRLVT
jgi:hypothetical protein